jgi:hypothetical protein
MCSLATVLDDGNLDALALSWLLHPDELVALAQREMVWASKPTGASHPVLLCSSLYGSRLERFEDVAAIADGLCWPFTESFSPSVMGLASA